MRCVDSTIGETHNSEAVSGSMQCRAFIAGSFL